MLSVQRRSKSLTMKPLLHFGETCLGERCDHGVLVLASPVALPPVVLDDTGDAPEMRMLHFRVHRMLGCITRKLDDGEQAQGSARRSQSHLW